MLFRSMQVFDNAINTGYTIAWGSDVSEKGFTRNGVAVAPDLEVIQTSGSDQDRWVGLSRNEKEAEIRKIIETPGVQEVVVTQEMRQKDYDNYQTTDDHGMQIFGIATDQTGKKFYMVKNSWGTDNKYNGIWYASEPFVAYKTMNIVVHRFDQLINNSIRYFSNTSKNEYPLMPHTTILYEKY